MLDDASETNAATEVPDYEPISAWRRRSGMSEWATYDKLRAGDLVAIKVGRQTLIDVKHGLKWLASRPRWTPSVPVQKSPRHKCAGEQAAAA